MDRAKAAGRLVADELGNWWMDDRRRWCAYCGIPMRLRFGQNRPVPPQKSTRDHIIPRCQGGSGITIPACRGCNAAKGRLSLPEFLMSAHFAAARTSNHSNRWPLDRLWLAVALAALKRADAGK